jgi:HAD superfamily hydrolase (TIGR01509 family)
MPEVVFDIGNVLLRWDPRKLYRSVFADEAACEQFLSGPLAMPFIVETDIAPNFAEAIAARARAFPDFVDELRLFDTRWIETLGGPIDENVALLDRLKASGARVHALSNFAHEKFALAADVYPFLRAFDVAVISGREGVAKPDPRIFEILLEKVGRPAGDLLFVDDSLKNVEAARALGIEAILYAPGVDLAREFAARSLLPDPAQAPH